MANVAELATSGLVLTVPAASDARQLVLTRGRIVLTTSGAIDATNSVTPGGFTVTKETGTGLYSVTHPETVRGSVFWQYYNAAGGNTLGQTGDIHTLGATAKSQIQVFTLASGDAADGASGDYIDWIFVGER